MSERPEKLLEELAASSENQVALLREGLQSSHELVKRAQRLIDGIRKVRGIPEGIQEGLKTLFAKLDEDEKQYTEIFRLVVRFYGDGPATVTEVASQAPGAIEDAGQSVPGELEAAP